VERCTKCGRLRPQRAYGRSYVRKASDRLLPYEGVARAVFRYTSDGLCAPCRTGTPNQLRHVPGAGEALKQWLIAANKRP